MAEELFTRDMIQLLNEQRQGDHRQNVRRGLRLKGGLHRLASVAEPLSTVVSVESTWFWGRLLR